MNALFKAQNITKQFAGHRALDNVDISVPEQSIFGLLGPNGAGKTTLIRIINQIIAADSGEIFFQGEKMMPNHTQMIGYLPEERGLYKKMKVAEQALYLARLKGMSKQDAVKKLKFWFDKFDILPWWNKRVEELSKGMQQKVQFIVTIIHQPPLLIFDEPFSGFDPINVNMIKDEILELREKGSTIIFSTHNMASVEELCDHIALINKAQKILDGKVTDIKNEYKSNTYEITYSNPTTAIEEILDDNFNIFENELENGVWKAKIRMLKGDNQNDLIRKLLPVTKIHSFTEILPSVNEIFIKKVQGESQKSVDHE